MVILKTGIMNKLLFIFCVTTLLSCGSKKKFNKIDSVENSTLPNNFMQNSTGELVYLNFLTSSIVKWKRETLPET